MLTAKVVKIDMSGIQSRITRVSTDSTIGQFAAEEAARLMQPYVPERDSILKDATPKPWKVMYTTPYAAAQYYGESFHHPKPSATDHWDRKLDKPALAREITNYIKQRGLR